MPSLTILVPILNEESQLPLLFKTLKNYPSEYPILICDGGSKDSSLKLIRESGFNYICKQLDNPSILKTIHIGIEQIKSPYTLIHPVDIVASKALTDLQMMGEDYGFFPKRYDTGETLLTIQSILLNKVRSRLFHKFVWTNCPYFKTNLLKSFIPNEVGFLEDIKICDYLRKNSFRTRVQQEKVIVSSRRYKRSGLINQMMRNYFIMLAFRTGLRDMQKLKTVYSKGRIFRSS